AALIEWTQAPAHSLIGAHFGTGAISQTLAEQVFGINIGSAVTGSIDRTTVNESYDLGKIIKYSVVGTQPSNYKQVTNISANVIANLTTGGPCFLEKNNHYYSCAENLKDVEYHKSPSQPLLLSAIRNLDIAMPKIKFVTIHDDSHRWYNDDSHRWYNFYVSGTGQRIIDAVTDIANGYGAREVQGFIADRFEVIPDGVTWFKNNEGKHDVINHSYSHLLFNEMTVAQQEEDFTLFTQRMSEYGLPYYPFFAVPSHSADLNTTPGIAANHGMRYMRTRMGDILPDLAFTVKDGVYLLTSANFVYKTTLEEALNEMLLVTYHGWLGLNNYSHIEDYDTPEKVALMNQALGIMNSISWAELSGIKEYFNLHRLNTNKFYRDGDILFAEITGAFPEAGYVELLVPKADATYCKIVDTNTYLLQCNGEEVYVPIPGNASSPINIEIHKDLAPSTIARLVSYENGVFFDKAEYDGLTSIAELHAFGFGKAMQMYYPQDTFSAMDNGVEFARVESDVLVNSDPLYNVSYNSLTNILSFEVPTLLAEANFRTLVFSPTNDTPPSRSNGSPTGALPFGTTSAALSLNTNENAICKYDTAAGVSYSSMANTFSTTGGTSHSANINGLTDGNTYNYYVRCIDEANNANTNDYAISFSVDNPPPPDTTPPVRSDGAPTGFLSPGTTQATLGVTTNENAVCKYSTVANTAYSSMTDTFSTTGTTNHSTSISGLSDGNTYNYYVRCEDGANNINEDDYSISFSISTPSEFIFSDDFETGDISNWTSSTIEAGNIAEVIPAAAYSGNYGLHIGAGGVNDDSRIMKQILGVSEAYMRVRVKLNQNVASGTHQGILTATYDANASSAIGAAAIRTQSSYTNRLFSHAASSWKSASDLNLTTNQWYCLETHHVADPATGRIRIWIDGELKADENNINTGTNLISWLRLGTDFSVVASDYYFDDFKVSSSQIGCN
ncbi:MAG: hypothetical protein HYT10_03315, partial [Candidatus Levybacteria bacterium]|nr:hypothetical protein [Candidatus Levybacteria bacterium]